MARTKKAKDIKRLDIKTLIDLYQSDPRAFRREYTRERDTLRRRFDRMIDAGGAAADYARERWATVKQLRELDVERETGKAGLSPEAIARNFAYALGNINTLLFSARAALEGRARIRTQIAKTLEERGYGQFSDYRLRLIHELLERARQIYGRKYLPSDEIVEMIGEGLGPELLRMTDQQLKDAINAWEARPHGEVVEEII